VINGNCRLKDVQIGQKAGMTYFYHFLDHICHFVSVMPVTFENRFKDKSSPWILVFDQL